MKTTPGAMAPDLTAVRPVNPVAPYVGGKRLLAKRICALIETIPHTLYAEPFVGMGGIFLRRAAKPKCEVINDWSADVSTFYRVLQHHHVAFMDMIKWQIASRDGFEKLLALPADSLTDLQRSARFLYLQRLAFGGKIVGRSFGIVTDQSSRFDVTKLGPMIEAVHDRLAGVTIERMDWQAFIKRYDRPYTLFYLDPPYFNCEGDYGRDLFDRSQFAAMADVLGSIQGQFILSINDHPEIRETFSAFNLQPVETRYSVCGSGVMDGKAKELIISRLHPSG